MDPAKEEVNAISGAGDKSSTDALTTLDGQQETEGDLVPAKATATPGTCEKREDTIDVQQDAAGPAAARDDVQAAMAGLVQAEAAAGRDPDAFRRRVLRFLRETERRQGAAVSEVTEPVRRRLRHLRYLQLGHAYLRSAYHRDVFQLERKYKQLLQPLLERRRQLVAGLVEPPAEEGAGDVADDSITVESPKVKGIPGFWLRALRNSYTIGPLITERDAALLQHLVDVRVVMEDRQPPGFRLEFHFAPNDYLSDDVLTKEFDVCFDPDPANPLGRGGMRVVAMRASGIHWKSPDVNVTRDVLTGDVCDSCFHFFSRDAPVPASDEDEEDAWERDVEVGLHLRASLLPRAVLFYTGEAAQTEPSDSEDDSSRSPSSSGSYWG